MTCSSCGMPCQGSMCKTCELTQAMEESWERRDLWQDADEEGED